MLLWLLSLPFYLAWYLITLPLEFVWFHPFISAFLGWVGYEVYQWRYGERRIGQLEYAVKKSAQPTRDLASEPPLAVIVGAGPGGLAVAATLADAEIPYVILEQTGKVGNSWRHRYERLHLHTTRNHSQLPFLPFPTSMPQFPSRDDVIRYLEGYSIALGLNIKFNHSVKHAVYNESTDRWEVTVVAGESSEETTLRPKFLIVASGEHSVPNIPELEGQNLFRGSVTHTSSYKNALPYSGKKVLVVGFGNSGSEIAVDLWENDAKPTVTVRSPVNVVPRGFVYLFEDILDKKLGARLLPASMHDSSARMLIQYTVGDLSKWGITTPHPTEGVITNVVNNHVPPLLDVGVIDLIKKGEVKVVPKGVKGFTETGVIFDDDSEETFDDVVLATGYKFTASYASFLDESIQSKVVNERQVVVSGKETAQKGLFFIGFSDMFGRFREINLEAHSIADAVRTRLQV